MVEIKLGASVGRGAHNRSSDVGRVQLLLNLANPTGVPTGIDGEAGPHTQAAIMAFQRHALGLDGAQGRVDPGGATLAALLRAAAPEIAYRARLPAVGPVVPVTDADYRHAAAMLGCSTAAIKAVAEAETRGESFLASGKPKILFEPHHFSRYTQHKLDRVFPEISWEHRLQRVPGQPSPYGTYEQQYEKVTFAMLLDRTAALKSASWGRFQILGVWYAECGCDDLDAFVDSMFHSAKGHLDAFVAFVRNRGLAPFLKSGDWAGFARGYNGGDYARDRYDVKIAEAYRMLTETVV